MIASCAGGSKGSGGKDVHLSEPPLPGGPSPGSKGSGGTWNWCVEHCTNIKVWRSR
jgi:hypothetical protein